MNRMIASFPCVFSICDVMSRNFEDSSMRSPSLDVLAVKQSSVRFVSLSVVLGVDHFVNTFQASLGEIITCMIVFGFPSVVDRGKNIHAFSAARISSCDALGLCRSPLYHGTTQTESFLLSA